MRKLLGFFAMFILASAPAMAQFVSTPKIEVGGGYAFRSFNYPPATEDGEGTPTVTFPRLKMNGFDANAVYNLNSWIGVAGDVDGTRNGVADESGSGTDTTWIYTVMGGARVYPLGHHKLTPFAQVMLGHGFLVITVPASSGCGGFCKLTDGSFAWSAGGGIDWTVSSHFAVRLGEVDYERTAFSVIADTSDGLSATNNNFKFKAGVIVRF